MFRWRVSELLLQTVPVEVVCLVSFRYCCCYCCYCSRPSSLRHRPGVRPMTSPLMSLSVAVATAQAVACICKNKAKGFLSYLTDHWKQAETILTTNQRHQSPQYSDFNTLLYEELLTLHLSYFFARWKSKYLKITTFVRF